MGEGGGNTGWLRVRGEYKMGRMEKKEACGDERGDERDVRSCLIEW